MAYLDVFGQTADKLVKLIKIWWLYTTVGQLPQHRKRFVRRGWIVFDLTQQYAYLKRISPQEWFLMFQTHEDPEAQIKAFVESKLRERFPEWLGYDVLTIPPPQTPDKSDPLGEPGYVGYKTIPLA